MPDFESSFVPAFISELEGFFDSEEVRGDQFGSLDDVCCFHFVSKSQRVKMLFKVDGGYYKPLQ